MPIILRSSGTAQVTTAKKIAWSQCLIGGRSRAMAKIERSGSALRAVRRTTAQRRSPIKLIRRSVQSMPIGIAEVDGMGLVMVVHDQPAHFIALLVEDGVIEKMRNDGIKLRAAGAESDRRLHFTGHVVRSAAARGTV